MLRPERPVDERLGPRWLTVSERRLTEFSELTDALAQHCILITVSLRHSGWQVSYSYAWRVRSRCHGAQDSTASLHPRTVSTPRVLHMATCSCHRCSSEGQGLESVWAHNHCHRAGTGRVDSRSGQTDTMNRKLIFTKIEPYM